MKQFLVLILIGTIVIACGNSSSSSIAVTAADAASPSATEGSKIYKQYCITCHGLYGDMGATGAFNLQETKLSLEERIAVITNGRNTMTGFKTLLSEEKIKAVAQYTFELKAD